MFAFSREIRYRSPMSNVSDFSLAVVANACSGAAALRKRLVAEGLDTTTLARLVHCSPLTIARATTGGATPRGVLIGLAALTTVIDRLNERGVGLADLARGGTDIEAVAAEVAGQSPVAARMLDRLRQVADLDARPLQLSLGSQNRVAA
jgi:hypothetical protein